jgi:hypothetical protein
LAAAPSREQPGDLYTMEFAAGEACADPIRIDVLVNKIVYTTFEDGRTLLTGRYVSRLTNLADPTRSVTETGNGPWMFLPNADGTLTLKIVGHGQVGFSEAEGGPGLYEKNGLLLLTYSPDGVTRELRGKMTSWCDAVGSALPA